jgi:hypothetical protein
MAMILRPNGLPVIVTAWMIGSVSILIDNEFRMLDNYGIILAGELRQAVCVLDQDALHFLNCFWIALHGM